MRLLPIGVRLHYKLATFDIRLTIAELAKFTWCRYRMSMSVSMSMSTPLIHVLESTQCFEFGAWQRVTLVKAHLIERSCCSLIMRFLAISKKYIEEKKYLKTKKGREKLQGLQSVFHFFLFSGLGLCLGLWFCFSFSFCFCFVSRLDCGWIGPNKCFKFLISWCFWFFFFFPFCRANFFL